MLVYFAMMLVALLGFCGLATDVGRMELRQVQLQAAADGAALSAAAELQHANNSWQNAATVEVAALATLNGYPMPAVAVQQGASASAYANDGSTVQVTLTQQMPTVFLGLLSSGSRNASLSATAVALMPPCIWLSGSPPEPGRGLAALALSSQGMNITCPMYSQTGYFVDGFSHIYGQARTSGPPSSSILQTSQIYPAIKFNTPVIPDPLAYLVAPVFSGCPKATTGMNYTSSQTISSGTYCGGLRITGTPAQPITVTLQPGLYIITGGVDIQHATVTGSGVTLYLTQGGGYPFGSFQLRSGSTMNLSAPLDNSNGAFAAILIFGDRNWVSAPGTFKDVDFRFDQSSMYGDGIIYTTNTGIYDWQTQLAGPHYFSLVTANFTIQNANLVPSTNFSQLPGGDPLHLPVTLVQ